MRNIFYTIFCIAVLATSCTEGLDIHEPIINPDPGTKKDTTYFISFLLKSTGTIDTSSVIVYNDSLQVRQQERILSGEWKKNFQAKKGFKLYVSIKGAVADGSVDLDVALSDSLNFKLQKQSKNNSQGKKAKAFEFEFEHQL